MPNYYDNLPVSAKRADIAVKVRDIILSLHKPSSSSEKSSGISYPEMSRRIEGILQRRVSADSIRQFANAETARGRVNQSNTTVAALYDFIVCDHHRFDPETRRIFFESRDVLGLMAPPSDALFALGALKWLHGHPSDVGRLAEKMVGHFTVLRRSTLNSELMKSTLSITRQRHDKELYLKAEHVHLDRSGRPRLSVGFIVPVVRNIYCAMQVEGHEGLEIFAIRDPIQQMPQFFMGFMVGLNGDRNLYNSNLLIERINDRTQPIWDSLPHRFADRDPMLSALGHDFGRRVCEVLSEPTSRLLTRFEDGAQVVPDLLVTPLNI